MMDRTCVVGFDNFLNDHRFEKKKQEKVYLQ